MDHDTDRQARGISLFWILQVGGWVLYWASHMLSSTVSNGWTAHSFVRYTTSSASGFLVTLLLRQVYRRIGIRFRSLPLLLGLGLLCSFLAANLLVWLSNVIRLPLWGAEATLFGGLRLLPYLRSVFWWVIPFVGWSFLYFGIKFWQAWNDQRERTEKAEALAQAAQLQMLRYRLNPHFLFNALNSIRALIGEDRGAARVMITELSEFLRYSLVSRRYPRVPLQSELEAVRHYLAVQQLRYEEKLAVEWDVDPAIGETPVPSFIIHPLVENAVRHGMRTSPLPLRIHIAAKAEGGGLRISVRNSGRWLEEERRTEEGRPLSGLANLRKRLSAIGEPAARLATFEREGFVHAQLDIPSPGGGST